MKLVTVSQMQKIEEEANSKGLSYEQMLENAGAGLAEVVNKIAQDDKWEEALGLVGPGNNGADTLIALTHLAYDGWQVHAYIVKRKKKDELVVRLQEAGGEVTFADSDAEFGALTTMLESAEVLLDGLLGTGIKLPLKTEISSVLEHVMFIMADMEEPPFVVAVDCPSGVQCDTGDAANEALPADLTVTMGAVKRGMLKLPAFELIGDLAMVDIGLPDMLASFYNIKSEVADHDLISGLLPDRPLDSHKGTFGTAFVAAGSINYSGAALLAGMAAYRSGAGLVTLAVPALIHSSIAGQFPEATWILLPHDLGVISSNAVEALTKSIDKATSLLLGPGFGVEDKTKDFIENLLKGGSNLKKKTSTIGFVREDTEEKTETKNELPPMVVDADGLRLLAKIADWHTLLPAPAVLTPHPGEMSALTGLSIDEIQNAREDVALKYAKQWGHVVVLKGAFTVIASPSGESTIIPVATPALARAGSGDVLAGLIVGFRAQGLDAYDAAVTGAYIHAQAGLLAADDLGSTSAVLAGDILDSVVDVMAELE